MILKASAENGASSDAGRARTSPERGCTPSTGGRSTGDGRNATTASSSGCTPLFLKADPVRIGTQCPASVPVRTALRTSSTVISSSPTNFSRMFSSNSDRTSISSARYSCAVSIRSPGMSTTSHEAPRSSPCQTSAFISMRSMTPAKSDSAPIGSWMTAALQPKRSRIVPST